MRCPNCGKYINHNSKFCEGCGASMEGIDEVATTSEVPIHQSQFNNESSELVENTSKSTTNPQVNAYMDKGKKISQMYFQFAMNALRSPVINSIRTNEAQKFNGIISLFLISLLLPLVLYLNFSDIFNAAVAWGLKVSPLQTLVITPFIYLAILLSVISATIFGITKLMKIDTSFWNVLVRFGSLLVVPIAFSAIAVVMGILQVKLSIALFIFAIILIFVAAHLTIYSYRNTEGKGLDVFYGIVILYLVVFILLSIVGETLANNFKGLINPF